MNNTFAGLSRNINKDDYLNSTQVIFATMKGYKRFPDDEEFCRELIVKDVYNFRNCKYLLLKLENFNRNKELIDVDNYTIEHIIPQNKKLSVAWQQELGDNWAEIQAKYLHTLGNLTLTGYNSELSDRPFLEKRTLEGGFAQSPLYLNKILANLPHWNEEEVNKRAETLSDLSAQIWSFPGMTNQNNELIDNEPNYSNNLKGNTLQLFNTIRTKILDLDESVTEEFLKTVISYKNGKSLIDIKPLSNSLNIYLNMPFEFINDPQKLCRDVSNIGHSGNGDIEIKFSMKEELEDMMFLIRQVFQHNC